jgi:hypothetical protein
VSRFAARARGVALLRSFHTGCGSHSAPYTMVIADSFSDDIAAGA